MAGENGSPDRVYQERGERFARERDRCTAHSRRLTHLRLVTFLAIVAPLLWPLSPGEPIGLLRVVLTVFFLAIFLLLVAYHQKLRERCRWYGELTKLNDEGRSRLARDWEALPAQDPVMPDPRHPFADDLDLFGGASLSSLLGTVGTPGGRTKLREWLLEPADPETVKDRQAAVSELAPMLDLREELTVRGRLMTNVSPGVLAGFMDWANGEPWLLKRPWLVWIARLLPVVSIALIVLFAFGRIDYTWWALALTVNLVISYTIGRNIHVIFDRAFAREGAYRQYAEIFRLIATAPFRAGLPTRLQAGLRADSRSAHEWIARLQKLLALAEVRFSMAYLPLQAVALWDFQVLHRLERWQRSSGRYVATWFSISDEVDALAALAALKHDNPGWVFPEIADDATPTLQASDLGHPLLADAVRVSNDVGIGPPHTFLMISGSNMSGKSTLLRAIGTNVVLALAGGPVCASAMRLPPVRVATSMRIHDSLQQGLSHFMAELDRLKWVVDLAREAAAANEGTLLYLLDDILQGTNTAERQIAARRIIGALLAQDVIGAVTTHDLALSDTPGLTTAARQVHFSESIREGPGGPEITFDYRLRPGVATSSNALKLLEMVGLSTENPDDTLAKGAD